MSDTLILPAAREANEAPATPRQPLKPTLIPPGYAPLRVYNSLRDLGFALVDLAGGPELIFSPSAAAYPGFDTFPALTVKRPDGEYLCTIAIQGAAPIFIAKAVADAVRPPEPRA